MSDVGYISFDLVIRSHLEEQLEKMRTEAQKPAQKLGEAISKTISESMSKTDISMPKFEIPKPEIPKFDEAMEVPKIEVPQVEVPKADTSVFEQSAEEINEIVQRAVDRMNKPVIEAEVVTESPPPVNTKAYIEYDPAQIQAEIDQKLKEPIDSLNKEIKEKLGEYEIPADPVEALREEINNTYFKLDLLQKKWQELSAAEPADKVCSQLQSVQQQIISTTNKIDKLEEKLGKMTAEKPVEINPEISDEFQEKADETAKEIKSKLGNASLAAGKKVEKALGDSFGKVKNKVSKIMSSLGAGFGKLTAPVKKFGKTLAGAFKGVFITAALYAGFRAIKDGFAEAAKADEKFASSLNEVKANLAVAFMPIIQTVMPMLNTLMSGLAAVTKSVAGFISGLFGTTYKQSAEAVKKLKTTSDAAKKAKMSMAGIDEMNVLSGSDSDNDTKENNGIDFSKLDMTEPKLPDWAERLKDSIRSGDWSGVGSILAERLNAAFSSIDWGKIRDKLNSGIKALTDAVNGFTAALDWKLLGNSLGEGINTAFSAVYTFFDNIDWGGLGKGMTSGLNSIVQNVDWDLVGKTFASPFSAFTDIAYEFVTGFDFSGLGRSLGKTVNSYFKNIDFKKAGKTLSEGIKGAFDTAINFVQTVDWQEVGEKIADFFSNIDYAGIASKVYELLGSALGAGVSLLWGAVKDLVGSVQQFFMDEFDRMDTGNIGLDIILVILVGIGDAIIGIGKWIYNNVFTPFINGFKEAFDIHSPSKVMEKMGGFIIDGLYKAIVAGITVIKNIFEKMREKIKEVFSKIHEWFEDKFSEAYELIQDVFSGIGKWFSERWKDIRSAFSKAADWFKEKFQTAWNNITAVFTVIGGWFKERWNDVKSVFSIVGDWFGEQFETAWGNIKNAFSDVKSWFENRWDDIKGIFSGVGNWFQEKFQCAYDNVTRIWDDVTGYFSGLWEDISNGAKDGVNWIIDKINGLLGAVESGLNFIVDAINSKFTLDIPDEVPVIGGTHFSMNMPSVDIPEIPHLANGGLATEPTLAMVGDNRNARTDPEVIAPLSKLREMTSGELSEIIELLKLIVELLKSGMNIEVINYLFKGSNEFSREVLKAVRDDRVRRGG